jgi:hypothetical protein
MRVLSPCRLPWLLLDTPSQETLPRAVGEARGGEEGERGQADHGERRELEKQTAGGVGGHFP